MPRVTLVPIANWLSSYALRIGMPLVGFKLVPKCDITNSTWYPSKQQSPKDYSSQTGILCLIDVIPLQVVFTELIGKESLVVTISNVPLLTVILSPFFLPLVEKRPPSFYQVSFMINNTFSDAYEPVQYNSLISFPISGGNEYIVDLLEGHPVFLSVSQHSNPYLLESRVFWPEHLTCKCLAHLVSYIQSCIALRPWSLNASCKEWNFNLNV